MSSSSLDTFSNFCISAGVFLLHFLLLFTKDSPFLQCSIACSLFPFESSQAASLKSRFLLMVYQRQFWFSIICFSESFFYPLTARVPSQSHIFTYLRKHLSSGIKIYIIIYTVQQIAPKFGSLKRQIFIISQFLWVKKLGSAQISVCGSRLLSFSKFSAKAAAGEGICFQEQLHYCQDLVPHYTEVWFLAT